jgi:hypothetical protein
MQGRKGPRKILTFIVAKGYNYYTAMKMENID